MIHCILTALGLYETPGPHESHSTLYTVSTLPPWKWGGVHDRITVDWSTNPTVRFCGADGGSVHKNKLSLVTLLRVHGTYENTAMGTCFSQSTSIWPLNHHSTNAQYSSITDPKECNWPDYKHVSITSILNWGFISDLAFDWSQNTEVNS